MNSIYVVKLSLPFATYIGRFHHHLLWIKTFSGAKIRFPFISPSSILAIKTSRVIFDTSSLWPIFRYCAELRVSLSSISNACGDDDDRRMLCMILLVEPSSSWYLFHCLHGNVRDVAINSENWVVWKVTFRDEWNWEIMRQPLWL